MQGIGISKFALDDVLSSKKGKLCTRLGDVLEIGNHKLIDQQFECDSCGKVFKDFLSVSTDIVEVADHTSSKENE